MLVEAKGPRAALHSLKLTANTEWERRELVKLNDALFEGMPYTFTPQSAPPTPIATPIPVQGTAKETDR